MRFEALKVGELANQTGLTIRTLHHYDAIGLLKPSLHSESGHRLYTASDVARLQQVLSLRQLGFSLEEVRDCLGLPGFSPLEVVRLHVSRLREQIQLQRALCERLEALAAHLGAAEEVSAEEFMRTIEVMTMTEKHYTPEQLEYLKQRRVQVGDQRMRQAPAEWAELMALVRAEMEKGTDPKNPAIRALAKRWMVLVNEFTGGDAGIEKAVNATWKNEEPALAQRTGVGDDAEAPTMQQYMEYIGRALQAGKQ